MKMIKLHICKCGHSQHSHGDKFPPAGAHNTKYKYPQDFNGCRQCKCSDNYDDVMRFAS